MRYFVDTEFNEETSEVGLISLGIVAEDGREFYGVNRDYIGDTPEVESCNDWVKTNVLPQLFASLPKDQQVIVRSREQIRDGIVELVANDPFPEFWGYFADYDWYLVCRLFGRFDQQPKSWNRGGSICYDLKQFMMHQGVLKSHLPAKFEPEHNALIDAHWTKAAFEKLLTIRDAGIPAGSAKPNWPR
jgi:hypothetical protein